MTLNSSFGFLSLYTWNNLTASSVKINVLKIKANLRHRCHITFFDSLAGSWAEGRNISVVLLEVNYRHRKNSLSFVLWISGPSLVTMAHLHSVFAPELSYLTPRSQRNNGRGNHG